MRIHLVTYATPRFRHRQWFLGWSARLNHVANTVTSWSPRSLLTAGFEKRVNGIALHERGSGFWSWKPFIIQKKLNEVPEGDIVFYCDVGRNYPFKMLTEPITHYLRWMDEHRQDVMPGISIPWKGPMSIWTKREAFVRTNMDDPQAYRAIPIQASFSFWRNSPQSRAIAEMWMDFCASRNLVSDDPSSCGMPELPGFHDHRHDQSLLTLCCLKTHHKPLELGATLPSIDSQHPSEVSRLAFGTDACQRTLAQRILETAVIPFEITEKLMRTCIKFGQPIPEPDHNFPIDLH